MCVQNWSLLKQESGCSCTASLTAGTSSLWRHMDCETRTNFEAFYELSNCTEDGVMLDKSTS